jgi:hypothetical protein
LKRQSLVGLREVGDKLHGAIPSGIVILAKRVESAVPQVRLWIHERRSHELGMALEIEMARFNAA